MKEKDSSRHSKRTKDLIAAIHLLATHTFHAVSIADCAQLLGDTKKHWMNVFVANEDYFRLSKDKEKVTLAARANNARLFHVDWKRKIALEEYMDLSEEEKANRVSRLPLSEKELLELIDIVEKTHELSKKRSGGWRMGALAGLF